MNARALCLLPLLAAFGCTAVDPSPAAPTAAAAPAAAPVQAPAVAPAAAPEGIAGFHQVTPTLATAGLPAPADMAMLKAAGYRLVVDLRTPEEGLAAERAAAEAAGLVWVNVPVTRAPERGQLDALSAVLDAHPGVRTLVHCASNKRASSMVMLDQVLRRGATPAEARRHLEAVWTPSAPWQAFIDATLAAPAPQPEPTGRPEERK